MKSQFDSFIFVLLTFKQPGIIQKGNFSRVYGSPHLPEPIYTSLPPLSPFAHAFQEINCEFIHGCLTLRGRGVTVHTGIWSFSDVSISD